MKKPLLHREIYYQVSSIIKISYTIYIHIIDFIYDRNVDKSLLIVAVIEGNNGLPRYPNIFPQPGHVAAEVTVYFVGPKNTVDQLMVLGATSRIKPNQLNVEEAYNWLRKLKLVNESYKNIIIDESHDMIQRMTSVRDRLMAPGNVLSVDHPLDVYIDRSLDGTSNSNGTDNDGIRFRGLRAGTEESSNTTNDNIVDEPGVEESSIYQNNTNLRVDNNEDLVHILSIDPQECEIDQGKKLFVNLE